MAQFYGTIKGSRGEVSRLGTKNSGLTIRANGWDIGVRVEITHENGKDRVQVFRTTGSNENRTMCRLVDIVEGDQPGTTERGAI
jgi:hypothetical protein